MILEISTGAVVGFITFACAIGPSIFYVGRLTTRVVSLEKDSETRGALLPRFYTTEQSVIALKTGQEQMLVELKTININLARLHGRFEEADSIRALEA